MTAPRPFAEVVEELTRLDAAATPGPWKANYDGIVQLTDYGKGYPLDFYPDCATIVENGDSYDGLPKGVMPGHEHDAVLMVAARNALPLLLSRLASREAVFEAAVAYLSDAHDCNDDEPCPHYDALSAAIEAARALDAAATQGEER